MSRSKLSALLLTGLIFHAFNILSVFDCYFVSPVVHGMVQHSTAKAQAKRLVLIVADGLRADLVFNTNAFPHIPDTPRIVAPYLRDVMERRGSFGISHTRVPTESRPGHVALIGGMYEDVSAVTKGWKTNPVDFDSVFNQSSHTFSFGSPDILPMFARGATPGKVSTWSYDEDEEDFSKDATNLDTWVFDQLQSLLRNASIDTHLDQTLRENRVVFFLHLLGLDTTGHSYRPHSQEYMKNIQIVDSIVRKTELLLDDFYGSDGETSYLFTADHGMSVIGNHGDGHPDNTRTPLVAWGKGIRGPTPDSPSITHDDYSAPWELSHLRRSDMEQADVAAMMATLIGSPWPVNGVGVLPDVKSAQAGYLNLAPADLAETALVNAKVILEQYRVKDEMKAATTLFYKPYVFPSTKSSSVEKQLQRVQDSIDKGKYELARQYAHETIQEGLEGLRYLQTYDRLMLRITVALAYLGWAGYVALFLFPASTAPEKSNSTMVITSAFSASLLVFWGLFFKEGAKWTYYIYISFPIHFWRHIAIQLVNQLKSQVQLNLPYMKILVCLLGTVCILESMVAAYTRRAIWTVLFILLPISSSKLALYNPKLYVAYAFSCMATSSFMIGGLDYQESIGYITAGSLSMLVAAEVARRSFGRRQSKLVQFQMVLIVLSSVVTWSSVKSLQAKKGLPLANQVVAWVLLVTSIITPMAAKPAATSHGRLLRYFLMFCPLFIILSIRIEGLFYVCYSSTLVLWVEVEAFLRGKTKVAASSTSQYKLQLDDLRLALTFLFFVQVGFFGTGNVASISSFYLEPVFRLVPVFSPFLMASLLILKIVAPYVILSACFATMNRKLGLPGYSLLLVSFAITDGMTIRFFWNVADTGSWLEIGQSISFFIISSMLLVWSAGIGAAGEWMIGSAVEEKEKKL